MQKQSRALFQPCKLQEFWYKRLHDGARRGPDKLNTTALVERGTLKEMLVHSSQRFQNRKSLHIDPQSPYSSALTETDAKHLFELVLEAWEEHQGRCLAQ